MLGWELLAEGLCLLIRGSGKFAKTLRYGYIFLGMQTKLLSTILTPVLLKSYPDWNGNL